MKNLFQVVCVTVLVTILSGASFAQDRVEPQNPVKPASSDAPAVELPDEAEAERMLEEARLRHELVGGNYDAAHAQFRTGIQQTLDALKMYLASPDGRKLVAASRPQPVPALVVRVKSTSAAVTSVNGTDEAGTKLTPEAAIVDQADAASASTSNASPNAEAKGSQSTPLCRCPCCSKSRAKR